MLKLKYLFENYSLAKQALENWQHDEDKLDEMLAQFRISSNAIYPFYKNRNTCFLRLSPIEEKMNKNILGELEFITYLLKQDYPALEPIKSISGDFCLEIDTKWGKYYATAFKEVAGMQIENTNMSNEIMFQYGKTLGELHSLSSKFIPKTKKWTHIEVLSWIEVALLKYNAPDYMVSELKLIENELKKLPLTIDNYGLVHYDFELDNVFYDDKNKTCSVIDFDDGMYHWYVLDIEQVFDSISDELDDTRLQVAKNEFIDGYKSEHLYTQEMQETQPLMRRFINLYGYARVIRCVAEKFSDEPEWLFDLRKKLDKGILESENAVRTRP